MLQLDPYAPLDDIKRRYKKVSASSCCMNAACSVLTQPASPPRYQMSIYVHPDKNPEDKERAQVAFEGERLRSAVIDQFGSLISAFQAVNRAYKMLEDEKERKKCLEVVDEAREQVVKTVRTALTTKLSFSV